MNNTQDMSHSPNSTAVVPASTESFSISVREATVHVASTDYSGLNGNRADRHRIKSALLSALWEKMLMHVGNDPFLGDVRPASPVKIVADGFGKPRLLVSGQIGPSVSFSYSGIRMWASVCPNFEYMGLDAAMPTDFGPGYPFHRCFTSKEFRLGLRLTGSSASEAAALLWSAKEATAKAVGSGFRFFGPLDVAIIPNLASSFHFEFYGQILKEVRMKTMTSGKAPIVIKSFKHRDEWISIAVVIANK